MYTQEELAFAAEVRAFVRAELPASVRAKVIDAGRVTADERRAWHGALHLASGGVGFLAMVAACLVLGRRFARAGEARRALSARVTGIAQSGGTRHGRCS